LKKLVYIFLFAGLSLVSFGGNTDKEKNSTKTITGKITDKSGVSIPGAKIVIPETGETIFADFDGNFKLSLQTDKDYSISINTIGFQPLELKSSSLTTFSDLSLSPL
jgi:hypothetical protein